MPAAPHRRGQGKVLPAEHSEGNLEGQRGFDDALVFGRHPNTLRWTGVTSTDPGLFQPPLRAGIDVKPDQLEPLRKAPRMPRVSLFNVDDVNLGKTIEAGLILRELLPRQKVHRLDGVAPPWVELCGDGPRLHLPDGAAAGLGPQSLGRPHPPHHQSGTGAR